jgi:uncharacterized damage-inducible protein DinB
MDAIAGLDEEGFRARPAGGGWTVAEVLAHLLDDEPRLLADVEAALGADRAPFSANPDDEREKRAKDAAQRMPVPQVLHGLLARRRDTLGRLESLPAEGLERPAGHAAYGSTTVEGLFAHIAAHELEHAAQIQTIRAETGRNRRQTGAL